MKNARSRGVHVEGHLNSGVCLYLSCPAIEAFFHIRRRRLDLKDDGVRAELGFVSASGLGSVIIVVLR